jgi:hypothetical protein
MPADVTEQVINALVSNDITSLGRLMDDQVTWHAVDAVHSACHNREEVLNLMQCQVAGGLRADVVESRTAGPLVVVGMDLTVPEGVVPDLPPEHRAYMVITTRAGKVVHFQDCMDRSHALGLAGIG